MDFPEQLGKQLRFLERSCSAYDSGDRDEAVRIATALANVFYDSTKSTSLLRHLGRKDIRLLSTSRRYPKEWMMWPLPSVTAIRMCPSINLFECIPNLKESGSRHLLFHQWWTEIIYRRGREKMNRRDFVLDARNKDGGSHVDAAYTVRYQEMMAGGGWKLNNRPDGCPEVSMHLRDIHSATLRQVAFETLHSTELLALAPSYHACYDESGVTVTEVSEAPDIVPKGVGWDINIIKFGQPH